MSYNEMEIARKKLETAVDEYLNTMNKRHPGALLIDWILVSADHYAEANGITATAVTVLCPFDQPSYRALGLLDVARLQVEEHLKH